LYNRQRYVSREFLFLRKLKLKIGGIYYDSGSQMIAGRQGRDDAGIHRLYKGADDAVSEDSA
jgi:hypothetical protein